MDAYQKFVMDGVRSYEEITQQPEPSFPKLVNPLAPLPATILIISPHPDDECLMGAYALRLMEDTQARVLVLPFTYGSKKERQAERKKELKDAILELNFELIEETVHSPEDLIKLIDKQNINMIFSPHAEDGHPTHQKAFELARDAILLLESKKQKNTRLFLWVQSEFWRDMAAPNLLVPLSSSQVIKIGHALLCHKGEVSRNPYHLRLPAWFQDQVRKGSERVNGVGAESIKVLFGQIYRQTFHQI